MNNLLSRFWKPAVALGSGALLAAGFPPFNMWQAAWIALAPLLLALVLSTPREGFRLGFLSGVVCWLISLSWLLRLLDTSPAPGALIVIGWVLLGGYCSIFTGGFGLAFAWIAERLGTARLWRTILLTLAAPVLWCGFEYLRSVAFGGFPWNLLGVTQYRNVFLIQPAEWFGVYGISAVLVLFNAGFAFTAIRYLPGRRERTYRPHLELFVGLMTTAFCFRAGMVMSRNTSADDALLAVAAVQPNIPQLKKWEDGMADQIHATLRHLTEQAATNALRPDVIVWPETATPYCVTDEAGGSMDLVKDLCRLGVPLLVGSMDIYGAGGGMTCFNSSFLFDGAGRIASRYDKQHLVPFGEYIPLSGMIPALARLAPMGWNCTAGREATVFRAGHGNTGFSCLICFEDAMPWLSRAFVRRGARLLVNQTNDAWFDRTSGPEQHLAQCVFRAVENRVPVLRVANSGITCLIQPSGLIEDATANSRAEPPEAAVRVWAVAPAAKDMPLTLYTRYGDRLFALPCGVAAGICFVLAFVTSRRKMQAG